MGVNSNKNHLAMCFRCIAYKCFLIVLVGSCAHFDNQILQSLREYHSLRVKFRETTQYIAFSASDLALYRLEEYFISDKRTPHTERLILRTFGGIRSDSICHVSVCVQLCRQLKIMFTFSGTSCINSN